MAEPEIKEMAEATMERSFTSNSWDERLDLKVAIMMIFELETFILNWCL